MKSLNVLIAMGFLLATIGCKTVGRRNLDEYNASGSGLAQIKLGTDEEMGYDILIQGVDGAKILLDGSNEGDNDRLKKQVLESITKENPLTFSLQKDAKYNIGLRSKETDKGSSKLSTFNCVTTEIIKEFSQKIEKDGEDAKSWKVKEYIVQKNKEGKYEVDVPVCNKDQQKHAKPPVEAIDPEDYETVTITPMPTKEATATPTTSVDLPECKFIIREGSNDPNTLKIQQVSAEESSRVLKTHIHECMAQKVSLLEPTMDKIKKQIEFKIKNTTKNKVSCKISSKVDSLLVSSIEPKTNGNLIYLSENMKEGDNVKVSFGLDPNKTGENSLDDLFNNKKINDLVKVECGKFGR